ncbi:MULTISPECIES: nuclear transport factor 2 family protein [Marinobacter]|uniref:Nuclear transport factor 2 family protein n=1 Tax=Marinobacter suaedae TaxID=3057675 RepID=A0ABT8W1Z8_9GAMM|nr:MULTISPECIES: nuclear transport factor 2 family protein [unclassified Marinobacter]MBZ2168001.1 nuclear transport factor 2 family protein [Marinobacter sp. F4216]MDO3722269.1 nuclear transport factor 2 family protein [Marinobacter sp. chi1]
MKAAPAVEVGAPDAAVPATLDKFKSLFNELDKGNLNRLAELYSEDIYFQDPLSSAQGLDDLTHYFASAYANAISCRFEFSHPVVDENRIAIPWVMHLRHKRINKGGLIQVQGISHLAVRKGKVYYHRDYFDAGQLLYENLPVMGKVIRWVKGYAG